MALVPFDSGRWEYDAEEHALVEHMGRPSLRLRGGIATIPDLSFTNGVIEFDLVTTAERGFMGGVWRVQDRDNLEWFFLRPHQSGNPDATQYTPVFNGVSGWQLYHGERYTVSVVYRFGEWFRVRILFVDQCAEIYVADLEQPALLVDGLKRKAQAGRVGLGVGGFQPGHFSNFSFTPTDSPPIKGRCGGAENAVDGVIPSWLVSDVFAESALDDSQSLDLGNRTWTHLETEHSGLANLARVTGLGDAAKTVFARKVIHSDHKQTKRLDFGFSDRVRVYLNGQPLFRGNDAYQSRDYRFLGSIGYYDALYLSLREGRNELVLAVTEDLGFGWGIQAKLGDLEGLTLED